ncbi:MAG TPA: hypothetical protein IAB06_06645 [Candidatus Avacidaminococcus intestinavium]|uniref:Uncharacterized protein n=1 Tax=Candidatus Avacidaminococcus intestinavium TaxID=2840684 RepID=A0A9D1MR62_9FIRM|nr:hypothetical protein [Candidatus Avacidaminococcus intestinavium]
MGQNALSGFIELVEKRYELEVIDSHYVLVDEKFKRYNTMIEVKLNPVMMSAFQEKYAHKTSDMHVAWSVHEGTIRFYAEVGNNILLLLDSLKENK